MVSAHEVAKFFILLSDDEAGDLLSNLKLQKLVYYAQGFHLAVFGERLFPEDIEAWAHGPVVPDLYRTYKKYGSNPIPKEGIEDVNLSDSQIELLSEVHNVYGQYSAWKLRQMTHEEEPWRQATPGGVISIDALKRYFLTQIV